MKDNLEKLSNELKMGVADNDDLKLKIYSEIKKGRK